jgi:hypothetical protein
MRLAQFVAIAILTLFLAGYMCQLDRSLQHSVSN